MQVVPYKSYRDYKSSVSPKGQITLPLDTRKCLGIEPKDEVTIRVFDDGEINVIPEKHSFLDHYRTVPALKTPLTYDEMRHIAYEERAQEIANKSK